MSVCAYGMQCVIKRLSVTDIPKRMAVTEMGAMTVFIRHDDLWGCVF